LLVVAAAVARVLDLPLEDADEEERRSAEHDGLADRVDALAEDVLGHLVAEEEDAPLLGHVGGVEEAPALLRDQVAHPAELVRAAGDVDRDRLRAVVELERLRVLARDRVDPAGLPADRLDVVLVEPDLAPLAEPLVRNRGESRPRDADRVSEPGAVEDHLP